MDFHRIWLVWTCYMAGGFLLGLIWFGIVEAITIRNSLPGDTLTEVVRSLNIPVVVWFIVGGSILGLLTGLFSWWVPHIIGRWSI